MLWRLLFNGGSVLHDAAKPQTAAHNLWAGRAAQGWPLLGYADAGLSPGSWLLEATLTEHGLEPGVWVRRAVEENQRSQPQAQVPDATEPAQLTPTASSELTRAMYGHRR